MTPEKRNRSCSVICAGDKPRMLATSFGRASARLNRMRGTALVLQDDRLRSDLRRWRSAGRGPRAAGLTLGWACRSRNGCHCCKPGRSRQLRFCNLFLPSRTICQKQRTHSSNAKPFLTKGRYVIASHDEKEFPLLIRRCPRSHWHLGLSIHLTLFCSLSSHHLSPAGHQVNIDSFMGNQLTYPTRLRA